MSRQSLGLESLRESEEEMILPDDDTSGFYRNAEILLMEAIYEKDDLIQRFQRNIADRDCVKC
jgi:hypothetical protein